MLVPGLAACVLAVVSPAYEGLTNPIEQFWRSALAFALFGAYPPTLVFGLPAFFMLRRRLHPTLINCSIVGALVAAFPLAVIALLATGGDASIDGRPTKINGSRTAYGWLTDAKFVGEISIYGAVGGALFWLIAAAGTGFSEPTKD